MYIFNSNIHQQLTFLLKKAFASRVYLFNKASLNDSSLKFSPSLFPNAYISDE